MVVIMLGSIFSVAVLYNGLYLSWSDGSAGLLTPPLPARPTLAADYSRATVNNEGDRTSPGQALHHVMVVTAFLDIGEFGKGSPSIKRDHNIYEKWTAAWRLLHSPVVFYTDSAGFAKHIQTVRKHLPDLTRVVQVNRSAVWAFQQREKIAGIYAAGYPKHWPNTVYPDYTCVTHAKFDFVKDAADKNYFPSQYTVWMDAGYLREKADEAANVTSRTYYVMEPPSDFDPTRVMCGQIYQPHFNTPWKEILRGNINWVGGGFFLGRPPLMLKFVEQYRRAVTLFLEQKESNVEQHVIYATYTQQGRAIVHPEVELQAVGGNWFTLGLRCLVPHTLPHEPSGV